MSASTTDQRASGKGEMPLFAAQKRRIRHNVEYLDSVATATGVLNTILNENNMPDVAIFFRKPLDEYK